MRRGQGCCSTSYNVQNTLPPPPGKDDPVQMSIVPSAETLRPAVFQAVLEHLQRPLPEYRGHPTDSYTNFQNNPTPGFI